MAMLIEGNGGDAADGRHRLIDVPGIEGGISGDVGRKEAQRGDGAEVERRKVGDIAFIEGLGILGQHDIPVDWGRCRWPCPSHSRTDSPF